MFPHVLVMMVLSAVGQFKYDWPVPTGPEFDLKKSFMVEPKPEIKPIKFRHILVFGAKWCGPCQQMKSVYKGMEKSGWSFGEEKKVNGNHLWVYDVDAEPELVKKYGVDSIPCYILVNGDGQVLGRITGMTNSHSLLKLYQTEKK